MGLSKRKMNAKRRMMARRRMMACLEGVGSIVNISPTVIEPAGYYKEKNPDLVILENDAIKVGLDFTGVISKKVPTSSKRRARRMRHVQFALERRNHLIERYAGITVEDEQ